MYDFAVKHNLINSKQFGFLKEKNSDDARALLNKLIYDNICCKKPTTVAFLDYSATFDTVDHKILFFKLHNMGIRAMWLSLIKSYLQDRTQNGKG